jgi:hypothetical protein
MTDDEITDKIVLRGIEDSWVAKLGDLERVQFIDFLEEMYKSTTIPSLRATLKVAVAHLRDNTKGLPTGIALG